MLTSALGALAWMIANPVAGVPLTIAGWVAFVHFSPYRECRWCRGKKGRCWRCKGTRLSLRLGARLVHKVKLSLLQAWDEREWWR